MWRRIAIGSTAGAIDSPCRRRNPEPQVETMSAKQNSTGSSRAKDEAVGIDDPAIPNVRGEEEHIAVGGFRLIERALLIVVALMTLCAAAIKIWTVYEAWTIDLADILLMFLYTEVIGMVAVFYTGRGSPFVYPIFIAITALARLIVLQGKDMAPENLLYEAGAILLLALAAVVIVKAGKT
jgi:protein PsiE